jgi:HD-like signal output (HDOD) protein
MTDSTTTGMGQSDAFSFVQHLAAELSAGKIDLPAFPDVAVRVRQVLADETVTPQKIELVVSTEPALAGKLLMIANSAALNPAGPRITSVKAAITRMGFNMVRSASLAFAMEQIRKSPALAAIREPMNELWERGLMVAGLSYVVAKRCTQVNPDTALLAGLLHGLGKLYILTRAAKQPSLWQDKAVYNQILRDWHSNVAKAILENWEISDDVVDAVSEYENLGRSHIGFTDLTDVLTVATLLEAFREFPESIELNMQGVKGFERMQLDLAGVVKLLEESDKEVGSLRAALGA